MSWQVDAGHSYVEFAVRHLGISTVRGYFSEVAGTLEVREGLPEEIHAHIPTASVEVRNPHRTQHMKSADFFDVERYPEIAFRSRATEPTGPGQCRITGDLTMMGRTAAVVLECTVSAVIDDPWGNKRIGFAATGTLDRKHFGMTWGTDGPAAGLVDTQVRITIDAEAVQDK